MVDGENRAALEALYRDSMYVARYREYKEFGITCHELMAEEGPYRCRVSFSFGTRPGEMTDSMTLLDMQAKVFCAPELEILEGSVVRIVRPGGKVLRFEASGTPAWYPSHQEVPLRATKKEA